MAEGRRGRSAFLKERREKRKGTGLFLWRDRPLVEGIAGATRDGYGADAVHTHMTNTRLTDPEVLEQRYPVRVREFSIRRGSGGKGAHHGGDGAVRRGQ